jgi:hypothetical protein
MTKRLELQCISGVSSKKMSAQNLILTRLGLNPDVQKCIYVPFGQVAQHAPFGVTGSAHGGWGHGIGWQKCLPPCSHGCGQLFVLTTGIMVVTSETNDTLQLQSLSHMPSAPKYIYTGNIRENYFPS